MQLIEGPEKSVRDLASKIEKDPRHRGIIHLISGFIEKRQFPEWQMGFKSLQLQNNDSVEGYSDILNTPFTSEEFVSDPTRGHKLLLSFKKHHRS